MTIQLQKPDITELKPRITVFGVGGGGGNAVNNMITAGLQGVDFVVANTDAQALTMTKADRVIQLGVNVTEGLGAGSQPEVGRAAAEECIDEIIDHLNGTHMRVAPLCTIIDMRPPRGNMEPSLIRSTSWCPKKLGAHPEYAYG